MNPAVKNVLLIVAKNAVNALLTNAGLAALWPSIFNFHNPAGILAFLKAAGLAVVTREVMVWGPKILKWSSTNATPGAMLPVCLLAATLTMSLVMVGCKEPPEQVARDVIAASNGAITTAQAKYHDSCVANPSQTPCEAITKAIQSQTIAVDALNVYCQFSPTDGVTNPTKACVPVKGTLPALQSAVTNLNAVTQAVEALINP